MTNVAYKVTTFLLLLSAVRSTSIQQGQNIYASKENGTLAPSNWEEGMKFPSSSVQVIPDKAKQHNSTPVAVQHEQKDEFIVDAHDNPSCPTWFFLDSSLNNTFKLNNRA